MTFSTNKNDDHHSHDLNGKVSELAGDIKSLKTFVKESNKNSKSDRKIISRLRTDLYRVTEEKDTALTSITTIKKEFELEKESLTGTMQKYADHFLQLTQSLKEESKTTVEEAVREVDELKKELEISKNVIVDLKVNLQKTEKARRDAETIVESAIKNLEEEISRELATLLSNKDNKLKEADEILREKEELIAKYERERGPFLNAAKFSLNAAGEQIVATSKEASKRGRSLVRVASARGRSLIKEGRSRSRSKGRDIVSGSRSEILTKDLHKEGNSNEFDDLTVMSMQILRQGLEVKPDAKSEESREPDSAVSQKNTLKPKSRKTLVASFLRKNSRIYKQVSSE